MGFERLGAGIHLLLLSVIVKRRDFGQALMAALDGSLLIMGLDCSVPLYISPRPRGLFWSRSYLYSFL
jgi:hypothetical protein